MPFQGNPGVAQNFQPPITHIHKWFPEFLQQGEKFMKPVHKEFKKFEESQDLGKWPVLDGAFVYMCEEI